MTVTIDDLETDFEGALERMAEEIRRNMETIPPERRSAVYMQSAAEHLAKMVEYKAPEFLIEQAEARMARHLRRRAKERSQSAGMKST